MWVGGGWILEIPQIMEIEIKAKSTRNGQCRCLRTGKPVLTIFNKSDQTPSSKHGEGRKQISLKLQREWGRDE